MTKKNHSDEWYFFLPFGYFMLCSKYVLFIYVPIIIIWQPEQNSVIGKSYSGKQSFFFFSFFALVFNVDPLRFSQISHDLYMHAGQLRDVWLCLVTVRFVYTLTLTDPSPPRLGYGWSWVLCMFQGLMIMLLAVASEWQFLGPDGPGVACVEFLDHRKDRVKLHPVHWRQVYEF